METSSPTSRFVYLRPRSSRRLWAALCVIALVLVLLKAWELYDGTAARKADLQAVRDAQVLREARADEIEQRLKGKSYDSVVWWLETGTARLPRAASSSSPVPDGSYRLTDPQTGHWLAFEFKGGKLAACTAEPWGLCGNYGPGPAGQVIIPLRRGAMYVGLIAWLGLCAATLLAPRFRVPGAELALIGSVVCAMLWITECFPAARWTTDNDLGPRTPLAILFSVGLALWAQPDRNAKPWSACKHCGYNLTGNHSGVCPECGTEVQDRPRTPEPSPAARS